MVKQTILLFSILCGFVLYSAHVFGQSTDPDPAGLLPRPDEMGLWRGVDSTRRVAGDELYTLIDGGADAYLEYGFTKAATKEFTDNTGKSLRTEIYEMADDGAAFGMYSLAANPDGEKLPIGDNGTYSNYYFVFWKGRYLVYLTGNDTTNETRNELLRLGKIIDGNIPSHGKKPALTGVLPQPDLRHILYIRGLIGLSSRYDFDLRNVFNVTEGVVGSYPDYTVFIFKYGSADISLNAFIDARGALKTNGKYENFTETPTRYAMNDRKGNKLCVLLNSDTIAIVLGHGREDVCRTAELFLHLNH